MPALYGDVMSITLNMGYISICDEPQIFSKLMPVSTYIYFRKPYHNREAEDSSKVNSAASVDLPDVEVDPVVVEVLLEEDRFRRLRQRLRSAVASPRTRTLLRGLKHIIALHCAFGIWQ